MAFPYVSFLFLLILPPLALLILLYVIVRPRPLNIPIKNRHVFITGGSSGIGLALARQAAAEGALVSILARSLDKLEEAKNEIRLSTGTDVAAFSADVRDYDAVKRVADEAGPIDVLVVNHGVFLPAELDKQEVSEVKLMVEVNLMGSFNVIKAALPAMKKRKDRRPASITLMSSMVGQVGVYGYAAYCSTKFGLRGLAEALQQEVIADNIHLSVVFPPETDTPALEKVKNRKPEMTNIIAASTGELTADEVSKITLNGIKSGRFIIPCSLDGLMMAICTAGLSPQRSFLMAFVEVVAAGIARMIAFYTHWTWYRMIEKMAQPNKREQNDGL
ncbi:hypothetical protein L6164_012692 [Bauhinia variegata]|uniref:Uncharacterized protein n=1 Tax=Bauhinia variegata TaxID=167791 RepID=A0ACB9PAT7_BAUVA|nr:hypothetical protein L6164_012692 [Bauhinia variegata]